MRTSDVRHPLRKDVQSRAASTLNVPFVLSSAVAHSGIGIPLVSKGGFVLGVDELSHLLFCAHAIHVWGVSDWQMPLAMRRLYAARLLQWDEREV